MQFDYDKFTFQIDKKFIENGCLFVGISGSYAFGWQTETSDLDVRVVFCPNTAQMISPFYKCGTNQNISNCIDTTYYPIDKYLVLLSKGNGNALDNLFEPKLYEDKKFLNSLQEIVKNHLHKGFIDHCIGYSIHVKKDLNNPTRIKKYGYHKLLLERYRELLKGKLLCDGKVEYNLPAMIKQIDTKYANSILASYQSNKPISKDVLNGALMEADNLEQELKTLRDNSKLPRLEDGFLMLHLDKWIKKRYTNT